MNKLIAKYFFFYPIRYLTGQNIGSYLKALKKIERLNNREIEEFQFEKIKNILSFAKENIPYYSKLFFENEIDICKIKSFKDMQNIPFLTKEMVQQNKFLLQNPKAKLSFKRTTSGSRGTPLVFYKDRHSLACMDAIMYNAYKWHGIELGDYQGRFWGLPENYRSKRLALLKDFLMNRKRLSAFDLRPEAMDKFLEKLKRVGHVYLYGYPSLIYQFALFIQDSERDLSKLKITGIIGTGELLVPKQKEYIESTFKCKFINEYGTTETGVIGFDCMLGNMHLMAHNIFFEVIKNGRSVLDEEGEIFVTELNTYNFPFIRYKLDDVGIIESRKCSCGLDFPIIEVTKGRIDNYILTPSGEKIYDAIFAYTLKKGVLAFKAIQKSLKQIDIYIIVDKNFTEDLQNHYTAELKNKIYNEIKIQFKIVDKLPRDKSGKLRYFVPLKNDSSM